LRHKTPALPSLRYSVGTDDLIKKGLRLIVAFHKHLRKGR